MKLPLSIAIITKNEEMNIGPCLESAGLADQGVIVDSGSTDKTLAIASEYECDVYTEDWKGFGAQKRSAIDKCRNPWILVLDADERISSEMAEKMAEICRSTGAAMACGQLLNRDGTKQNSIAAFPG